MQKNYSFHSMASYSVVFLPAIELEYSIQNKKIPEKILLLAKAATIMHVHGPFRNVVGSVRAGPGLAGSMILGTGAETDPDRSKKKVHSKLWSAVEDSYNFPSSLSHDVLELFSRAIATRGADTVKLVEILL